MKAQEVLQSAGWPTKYIVVDFEAYFDTEYSLSNLSHYEYIKDPRFEIIGCGFYYYAHEGKSANAFYWQNDLQMEIDFLIKMYGPDLEGITVVVQNGHFDCLVLKEVFGILPKYCVDVKHLDAHIDARRSHRLKDMAKRQKLSDKGETMQFSGIHLAEMTAEQRAAMEAYCLQDTYLERELFEALMPYMTNASMELPIAWHTTQLYLNPVFEFDFELAGKLRTEMQSYIDGAVEVTGLERKEISGNLSFTTALKTVLDELEQDLPVKPHKRPGKNMTALLGKPGVGPALSKEDDGMKWLLAHSDDRVRHLAEARIAVKSWNTHIKRVDKMTSLATAAGRLLPVPMAYYGAHCVPGNAEVLTRCGWKRLDEFDCGGIMQWEPDGTLQFLHADNNKFQNTERNMIAVDSPYIKARFTQGHTVPRFNASKKFAACKAVDLLNVSLSNLPISGTYTGAGTLSPAQIQLLVAVQADGHWQLNTQYGRELRFGLTKPRKQERLRNVLRANNVEFREHEYKSHKGEITFRIRWADVPDWLTPQRKYFSHWLLDTTAEARQAFISELQYWDGYNNGYNTSYYSNSIQNHAWVRTMAHLCGYGAKTHTKTRAYETIIRTTRSPEFAQVRSAHTRLIPAERVVYCPTTETGYWLMRYAGTISVTGNTGRAQGSGGINLCNLGGRGRAGSGTHPLIGKVRNLLRAPAGYKLCIADSAQIEARLLAWLAGQENLVQGFERDEDIYSDFATGIYNSPVRKPKDTDPAPVGKILTIQRGFGKDTILGAGYGMGPDKFHTRCLQNAAIRPLFDDGTYDFAFVKKLIYTYRKKYARIPEFWKTVEKMFAIVTKFPKEIYRYAIPGSKLGNDLLTMWNDNGTVNVQLPSGRVLYYQHAKVTAHDNQISWHHGHLWGGSLTENIIQSIARDLLMWWILKLERIGIHVIHHVYDETIAAVPEDQADVTLETMINVMRTKPSWADGAPLNAEGQISDVYTK